MNRLTLSLNIEKETKNTVRYVETAKDNQHIIYLQKAVLPKPFPKSILVTIEENLS